LTSSTVLGSHRDRRGSDPPELPVCVDELRRDAAYYQTSRLLAYVYVIGGYAPV